MNDLFYFTKAQVQLDDIASSAISEKYKVKTRTLGATRFLYIVLNDQEEKNWEVFDIETDFNSFDIEPRKKIDSYQPLSSFVFTFPSTTLPELTSFLKKIIDKYGGWIGMDDDMLIVYNADNIATITKHIYSGSSLGE